jgi:Domain of unknown function (DUF6468)
MSTQLIGMAIESLVAVLLVMTIGYCWVLNSRLTRLRADEKMLRTTILELVTSTEAAERSIGGLKDMVAECDRTLTHRLGSADRVSGEIAIQIRAGEMVLNRIALVTEAARKQQALQDPRQQETAWQGPAHAPVGYAMAAARDLPEPQVRQSTARAAAAVAEALAQRARGRSRGEAA